MSTFGERVKEARIAAGLTQAQLASRAGFKNQSAIGNIENSKRGNVRFSFGLSNFRTNIAPTFW